VRALIEAMPHILVPAPLIAQIAQVLPVAPALKDSVVTLVWVVKSMQELGCELFLGEPDAEIACRWLCIVEETIE
jgi:hypothetical protein